MNSVQDAPRAYLGGFNIPVDHKMPDLAQVRNQAAKGDLQCTLSDSSKSYSDLRQWTVTQLMRAPILPRLPALNATGKPIGSLLPASWYNSMLPDLFQFCYFCFVGDGKFYCISRYIYFFLIVYSSRKYFTTMYLVSQMDNSCLPGRLRRATEDIRSSRTAGAR